MFQRQDRTEGDTISSDIGTLGIALIGLLPRTSHSTLVDVADIHSRDVICLDHINLLNEDNPTQPRGAHNYGGRN